SQGKLSALSQQFARLGFQVALDRYFEDRAPQLCENSLRSQRDHAKPLREYFAALPLARVSAEAIFAYIRDRKAQGISNVTVNIEIGILRRVLRRAKCWYPLAEDIKPLPEPRGPGRALSYEEKVRLTKTAGIKPAWQIARLAMTLALNTTMRGCELK